MKIVVGKDSLVLFKDRFNLECFMLTWNLNKKTSHLINCKYQ